MSKVSADTDSPAPGLRPLHLPGVPEMSDAAHRQQGRMLATRGYVRERE